MAKAFSMKNFEKIIRTNPLYGELEHPIIEEPSTIQSYLYFNVLEIIRLLNSDEDKSRLLKSLMLEINRLSWEIFEKNKICGANCINVFSPKTAKIFDMFNVLTDNIKFNNKNSYQINDSYFIGDLNNKYKVFMPKETTRVVLNEKNNNQNVCSEKFVSKKWDIIEIYNSEMPENKFIIKLENLQ